jgi:hypothetical protein
MTGVAHNLEEVSGTGATVSATGAAKMPTTKVRKRTGGGVNDRQRGIAAAIVGAVAGGIAGYMLFTERGRELRRQLEPALEDFAHELVQLRGTVNRAMGVASQGWNVLNEVVGERGESGGFSTHQQSNPF